MAYEYNGQDHRGNLGEIPLTATGVPFSVAVWFKPDSTASVQSIVNLASTAQGRIEIGILSDTTTNSGRLRFVTMNQFNNGQAAIAPIALTIGEWHHAVGVCATLSTSSYGTRRIYLNGTVATAQNTANLAYTASFNDLRLAHRRTNTATSFTNHFEGSIGEVAFWSEVLSIDDIAQLAAGVKPTMVQPNSLTCYLPLVRALDDVMESRAITNTYVTATANAAVVPHPRRYG
jgi:hypothetical protein